MFLYHQMYALVFRLEIILCIYGIWILGYNNGGVEILNLLFNFFSFNFISLLMSFLWQNQTFYVHRTTILWNRYLSYVDLTSLAHLKSVLSKQSLSSSVKGSAIKAL